jgi:hypothetical protein
MTSLIALKKPEREKENGDSHGFSGESPENRLSGLNIS